MAYFLGFDGGGTKTECSLARDEMIVARASSGTIKLMRTSSEQAEKNLDELLQSIVAQTCLDLQTISCTCVGIAGNSIPRIGEFVRQSLHARIGGQVLLAGDQEIALDAAFHGGAGVMVIAGTGSNLIARSTSGKLIYIGGWGPAVADEGSGNWIGKQAVRSIFEAFDYGEKTLLHAKVLSAWNLPEEMGALIDRANESPGPDFSRLTPIVVECARMGDSYASRILQRAGEDLGRYAALAIRRSLDLGQGSGAASERSEFPEVAFSGSVLRCIPEVRDRMAAVIRREFPAARVHLEAVDPVEGALWRAREAFRRQGTNSELRGS
jgi:N-acetylglucosamine kinase-like BadF-type ATPase